MRSGRLRRNEINSVRKNLEEIRKKNESEKNKKANRMNFYILVIVIIAVLTIASYLSFTGKTIVAEVKYDMFAKCLSSNGLILFGSDSCDYCDSLKSRLGKSFNYLNYVDCSNGLKCKNINEYPTWFYNNQQFKGNFSLQELSIIMKCVL